MKHDGVIVPMSLPVTPDGRLDEPAAERLVEQLAVHGLHVFVLGTTGESASVPGAARLRLVQIAVRTAARRVRVYAGISDNCLADSVSAGREYLQAGVDAVVAHAPWFFQLNDAEIAAWFTQLVAELRGPFMLYNIPQVTRHSVSIEVAARLAELPDVIGFKDSENTPGRLEAVYARLGGRPHFSLVMGTGSLSTQALRRGYDGLVPATANFAPTQWRDLYAAARAGEWDRAEPLQQQMIALAGVFQKNRSLGQWLAAMKAGLHLRGLCSPAMLPPLEALDSTAIEALRAELTKNGFQVGQVSDLTSEVQSVGSKT